MHRLTMVLNIRPGNAMMAALFSLVNCVFESPEKELIWEQGGRILMIEDSIEKLQIFETALKDRSWNSSQFEVGRSDPNFKMNVSSPEDQERWNEMLNHIIDHVITSITITEIPQPESVLDN